MAALYPATLLDRSGAAAQFVDDQVVAAVRTLVAAGRAHAPSIEVLAVACLGSTDRIVSTFISAGIIPTFLEEDELDTLKFRLGYLDSGLPDADVLNANAEVVAAVLSLPVATEEEQTELASRATAGYPLFPHQRRAVARLKVLLVEGGRVMLHMPTGSGKTRTAMNTVSEHLRQHEGGIVLWIASTSELLQQAAVEFQQAWHYLGNREVDLHLAWGGRLWDPDNLTSGLLLASPQTLYQRQQKEQSFLSRLADKTSLVVFDEAHQSVARTYQDSLEGVAFTAVPPKPVLGLSATPGRTYVGSEDDEALAELYDHEKVELDTTADGGPSNPVDYLIAHGYLAEPEFRLLGDLADPDAPKPPAMTTPEYLAFVAEAVLDLIAEGHLRVMVFARSVEEADRFAATLKAVGVLAESVNGNTPQAQRDTATRLYKTPSHTPRVLVNFGVFTAGFDAPQTSAAVIARPTRSLVAYSQMVGRAIRGPKAGGNNKAVILTVVDPDNPEFGSIAKAFTNWNGMWD